MAWAKMMQVALEIAIAEEGGSLGPARKMQILQGCPSAFLGDVGRSHRPEVEYRQKVPNVKSL